MTPALHAAEPPTERLKDLAFDKLPAEARSLFESVRPRSQPLGAEWLEAMSWVGRAGAIGGDWQMAAEYAETTLKGCEELLEQQPLGDDPEGPFAIALGAAIETLGKFYVANGDQGRAVVFLRERSAEHAGTAVETRINKNLLLLSLEGKPMPALDSGRPLGAHRMDASRLRGNVALFFFWAHWCSDCRAQKPVLDELQRRYADRGLRIVAPTRLYGYIVEGRDAEPEEELAYIVERHVSKDPLLQRVPVPLSGKNFADFGVSTTPTLVLVDRQGIVRLYHPGDMPGAELAERIEALL